MAKLKKPTNSKQLATFVAKACDDKIAKDIVILDLTKIGTAPADFFVLCSCDSQPQVGSIVDELYKRATEVGISKPRAEGIEEKEWALMDFFDVVVHVMLQKSREYYRIERLWADATFYVLGESGRTRKLTQKEILNYVMATVGDSNE